jgi:hypothetical protein
MRLLRRLLGLLAGTAGLIGLLLCVAGLVGVWVGYVEIVRRVDRVFDRADGGLAGVQENLRDASARLREAEAELESVRNREAELATQPPAQRSARRAASKKTVEALGPGLGEARSTLVKATEAALVANGWLDALAELPAVERVNIDADRLKEASDQLGELTERTTRLTDLLGRAAPADDAQVAGESSRAVEAVRRPIVLAEAASDRLDDGRGRIASARARVLWWVNAVAVALAVVLVWIAAGQFSLLVHGGKLVRR